jgi:hypothetical protein
MRLYNCTVRLGGSLYNEVPKTGVTAAEILLLRILHGNDGVANIEEAGKNAVGQAQERDRLVEIYGAGIASARQLRELPEQAIVGVFGLGSRLPDEIPGAPKAKPKKNDPAPAPVGDDESDDESDPEPEDPEE